MIERSKAVYELAEKKILSTGDKQCYHQYTDGVCDLCDWCPIKNNWVNRRIK